MQFKREKFPAGFLREKFKPHFQDSEDLIELFNDMCDLVEGTFDPWEKINQLKLYFYEFDEFDQFDENGSDFDDWLINAGMFILIIKSCIMHEKIVDRAEIPRFCDRFKETLDRLKPDFHEEEMHYYFSFSFLNEFTKSFIDKDISEAQVKEIESFVQNKLQEINEAPAVVKQKTLPLLIPYMLDLLKLHPEALAFMIDTLRAIIDELSRELGQGEDTIGLCVRTLSFRDYTTASPPDLFSFAIELLEKIHDPFVRITASIHVAIGHSLRGEGDAAVEVLARVLDAIEVLPTPNKEVSISFLMRGCVEAGVDASFLDTVSGKFKSMIDEMVEDILTLNDELGTRENLDDAKIEEIMGMLETDFIIFSSILDNLGMMGLHVNDPALLVQVETLLERVNEINIAINFKSKLAVYYQETSTSQDTNTKPLLLVKEITGILEKEVEHFYLEDLFDFFLDHAKNCLELAMLTGESTFIDELDHAFVMIKERKNLEIEDSETLLYQVLSAIQSMMSEMWSRRFGMELLQADSFD
ncbi:MAG TPA: hypothetical protein VKM55_20110 [Candidatus Lokiarchaeia archaeon]|nr:hypothetical protein [Candidatus Lokiarchaeia archaeon]